MVKLSLKHGSVFLKGVFWDEKIQSASREKLEEAQLKLLRAQLKRVYENSRFYRRKFTQAKVDPSQIRELADIRKIPFTTRKELEGNFKEIVAIPWGKVAALRMTTGTMGTPLTIAHSKKDLEDVAEATARKLTYHGVTGEDVVQVTASYGLWQGAWSIHSGAEKIGCCIIPVGSGNTERQIRIIKQFGTTVLYGVTNYHFRIAEVAKQHGDDMRSSNLKIGICVAEKPTKSQIDLLKKEFGYETVAIDYGATEFPGFSVHCAENPDSHHVWADYHLVETVTPDAREPVENGVRGELVVTTLQREAFPLIRYLSNDVTELKDVEECECGMSHPKIGIDIDRIDYMTKIRGTPVFPSRIEYILREFSDLTGRNQIVLDKRTPKQHVLLRIEKSEELSQAEQESLRTKLRLEIRNRIGVTIDEFEFVPSGTFEMKFKKSIVLT